MKELQGIEFKGDRNEGRGLEAKAEQKKSNIWWGET